MKKLDKRVAEYVGASFKTFEEKIREVREHWEEIVKDKNANFKENADSFISEVDDAIKEINKQLKELRKKTPIMEPKKDPSEGHFGKQQEWKSNNQRMRILGRWKDDWKKELNRTKKSLRTQERNLAATERRKARQKKPNRFFKDLLQNKILKGRGKLDDAFFKEKSKDEKEEVLNSVIEMLSEADESLDEVTLQGTRAFDDVEKILDYSEVESGYEGGDEIEDLLLEASQDDDLLLEEGGADDLKIIGETAADLKEIKKGVAGIIQKVKENYHEGEFKKKVDLAVSKCKSIIQKVDAKLAELRQKIPGQSFGDQLLKLTVRLSTESRARWRPIIERKIDVLINRSENSEELEQTINNLKEKAKDAGFPKNANEHQREKFQETVSDIDQKLRGQIGEIDEKEEFKRGSMADPEIEDDDSYTI